MSIHSVEYSRKHPFMGAVKECYPLVKTGSIKDIQHVVLDITGSGISYEVGDCVGILPENPPEYIKKTLEALQVSGQELVLCRHSPESLPLQVLLSRYVNLSTLPRKLIELAAEEYVELKLLLQSEDKQNLKKFLENREVWDFLLEHPLQQINVDQILNTLQPLLPRFYSIASHQESVGEEIHLTVAHLAYESNGYQRWGICTHYLCQVTDLQQWSVPLYIQPHKGFTLPHESAHIIMIGPGTGVAPYRGFMQKRVWRKDTGKSWLFFGECHEATDFLYEDFWRNLEAEGTLRLSTAFSRDQTNKIYVQHRMWEHADELYQWIKEGAYIFVCGDASHMAKDVEAMLLQILEEKGQMTSQDAANYIKEMRHQKRYLRDVY